MRTSRRIAVAGALLVALTVALPTAGNALPPIPLPSIFPSPSPSPSVQPPRPSPTGSPHGDGPNAGTDGVATPDGKTPPFRLTGPNNTAKLVETLSELTRLGIPLKRALISGMGRLPVAGIAYWSDDWHAPRCCPEPHEHQGLDVFAPKNAPALAVAEGTVTRIVNGPVSGKAIYLTDAHGTYYFYGHLNGFAKELREGQEVHIGQVLGYVGNTGNAVGTPAHIHFEVHPGGGVAVPPKPHLDRWLAQAEREAEAMIARRADELAMAERVDFRLRRAFDLEGGRRDRLQRPAVPVLRGDAARGLLAGDGPADTGTDGLGDRLGRPRRRRAGRAGPAGRGAADRGRIAGRLAVGSVRARADVRPSRSTGPRPGTDARRPYGRKFVNCSGIPKSCSFRDRITTCRSSFFFPVIRI